MGWGVIQTLTNYPWLRVGGSDGTYSAFLSEKDDSSSVSSVTLQNVKSNDRFGKYIQSENLKPETRDMLKDLFGDDVAQDSSHNLSGMALDKFQVDILAKSWRLNDLVEVIVMQGRV